MVRTLLRVILLLSLLGLPAQDIPIRAGTALETASTSPGGLRVLTSDLEKVRLELRAPEPLIEADPLHADAYPVVRIPGYGLTGDPGAPQLPVRGFMVAVPPGAEVELRIVELPEQAVAGGHRVAPAPTWELELPPPDLWESQVLANNVSRTLTRVEDPAIYSVDATYPSAPVQLTEIGYIRHQRVAHLAFYPVQANLVSGELLFSSRVLVELTFAYPHGAPDAARLAPIREPDSFESLLEKSLVNYSTARAWRDKAPSVHASALAGSTQSLDPGYRITVLDTGIYELTYSDLITGGLPVETLDPRTFQLFHHGQEAAISVAGEEDGIFDAGDTILFYGEAISGKYAKYAQENVYWLTYGQTNGRRMAEKDGTPWGATTPTSFEETLHFEEDKSYWSLMPGEDDDLARWYWDSSIAPGVITYTAGLTDVVSAPVSSTISVALHGYNNAFPYYDHHVAVYVNDTWVGEATWEGISTYLAQFAFPQAYLQAGDNLIQIESIENPAYYSANILDWFEIGYQRAYRADQDVLAYQNDQAGEWEFQIDGFTSAAVETLDVTNPLSPRHVIGAVVEPNTAGTYRLRLGDIVEGPTQYWSQIPAKRLSPTAIQPDTPSNLSSPANGADYVMITHHSFYADLLPLADYYASVPGFRVRVVDVQDVYDEFSGGILYPGAIRAFLAYAYQHWVEPAPAYVLLVGDGHYDFRFLSSLTNQAQYLPPYLARVDPWIGETATDNRYVSISGEDAWPDMHIGRFPVNSQAQIQAMVSKSLAYQTSPPSGDWNRKTLFVTDNPDGAGNFHIYSDIIVDGFLPEPYSAQKVYYGQAPYTLPADVTAAIQAAISEGRLLVSYIGHAAIPWWAQERLFQNSNVNSLTNTTRWPVMLPMTCQEGQFSFTWSTFSSLSETIVRASAKGAIASWAPTGYGVASGHSYLEEGFLEALFFDGIRRLGDATLEGKRYLWENAAGAHRELMETYVLLGDPYLQVYTLKAEVGIEKSVTPTTPLQPTDLLTYTLSVVNQGPATAHRVVITDLLPAVVTDAQVISTTLILSQRPGDPFAWDVEDLAPGRSGTIAIQGRVDGSAELGLFTNRVRIATTAWETGTLPNQDSVTSQVVAGPPALIQVTSTPTQIPVGGSVSSIEALVTDLWGNLVADGTVVNFTTDLGTLNPSTTTTADGLASTTLTSGPAAGMATVMAAAGNAQGTVQVTFRPGPPNSLQLSTNPVQIPVGGSTSTLTAVVRDQFGNPVADGTAVSFSTTKGSIAPTQVTTAGGIAQTTLTSGTQVGVAVVTAQAGTASTSANVAFIPGPPSSIHLAASPTSIPVGAQASLVASVTDQHGNPVADGTSVAFSTSQGSVSPALAPTTDGQASSTFMAGTFAGDALVTATAGDASGQTVVPILPGPPTTLNLVAFPTSIPLTGTAALTATVVDQHGNPVADGTGVDFASTLGTMDPQSKPTWSGVATSTLQAEDVPGLATVIASAGPASDSAAVQIGPGVPVSITLTAAPDLIVADGVTTSTIAALLTDSFGEPITQVIPITFETTLGHLAPLVTWVVGGEASAVLTGTQTGVAVVSAKAANTSDALAVTLAPGPPAQVTVSVTPTKVRVGGQAGLQAQVADAFGNAVANGTWVTFATSLGTPDPLMAVTDGGVALSTFFAGPTAGAGVVTATAGDAWGEAGVTVLPGPVAGMTLTATPPALKADGQDQAAIEATLVDAHGNPVADGTEMTFSSTLSTVDPVAASTLDGKAYTILTAGTMAGEATVTGVRGFISTTLPLTLLPGPPAILGLVASPASIPANGQSQATLAVTMTDAFGNPVSDGTWVTFSTSLGTVWPVAVTSQASSAQSALTSSTQAGLAVVTATAGAAWDHVWVTFRPGASAVISLTVAPPTLVANGVSTATVTALVMDAFDNPVQDGTRTAFSTNLGSVSPISSTTQYGIAQTTYRGGTELGLASLAASSGAALGQAQVALVAGPPAYLSLSARDTRLPVGARFTTWLTATVWDASNHLVADGIPVTFTVEAGSIEPGSASTVGGAATVLYTGTWLGRWTIVRASTVGGVSDTVAIWLEPYRLWFPLFAKQGEAIPWKTTR
jgi:uncharacterized repeat protein (TIGR01451 family)